MRLINTGNKCCFEIGPDSYEESGRKGDERCSTKAARNGPRRTRHDERGPRREGPGAPPVHAERDERPLHAVDSALDAADKCKVFV